MMKLRDYCNADFIRGALVFFVIQPAIVIFAAAVFLHGVYQTVFQ